MGTNRGSVGMAEETAYFHELCRVWAHLLRDQLLELAARPLPSTLAHVPDDHVAASRLATSAQPSKSLPPLLPEFQSFVRLTGPREALPASKLKADWDLPPSATCYPPLHKLPAGSKVTCPSVYARGGVASGPCSLNVRGVASETLLLMQ